MCPVATLAALAADLVVLIHLAFVVFVVAGGFLVLWKPRVAWAHVPAAVWGVFIEVSGRVCPLTPLENRLRVAGGESAYAGDFVERYIMPVLYPVDLTREIQVGLGVGALAVNVAVYTWLWRRARRARARGRT